MSGIRQLTTFSLGDCVYGIDVMRVQEVTSSLPLLPVPIAPAFVRGLVNLRGQIATAIGLNELFGFEARPTTGSNMTVICKVEGTLLSLLVDAIGDVIEISESDFEAVPETVHGPVRKYMGGIYKTKDTILGVIDIDKLAHELNENLKI